MSPNESANPPTATLLEETRIILESWYFEIGQPSLRPSWAKLRGKLSAMGLSGEDIFQHLLSTVPVEQALLVILPLTTDHPENRQPLLQHALLEGVQAPCGKILGSLLFFPSDEVRQSLLPLLQEPDPASSRALYLMARAGLTLVPKMITEILLIRPWESFDIANLGCLSIPDDRSFLETKLKKEPPVPTPEDFYHGNRDRMLAALREGGIRTPVSPDSFGASVLKPSDVSRSGMPGSGSQKTDAATAPRQPLTSGIPAPSAESAHEPSAQQKSKGIEESRFASRNASEMSPEPKRVPGISGKLVIGVVGGAFLGFIVAVVSLNQQMSPPEPEVLLTPSKEAPHFYTDAVSGQVVTREFLAADSDYQMGELFLTRGEYGPALSLFRDALARYPKHAAAQFREGVCLMSLKDFASARVSIQKALSMQSDLPMAHSYLGRMDAEEHQWDKALTHFQSEFNLRKDLGTGIEFTKVLLRLGRFPEAREVAAFLDQKYPGSPAITDLRAEILRESGEGQK